MPRSKAGGAAPAARKPRAPKAAGGHQLAEELPAGEVLKDCIKGEWKVGKAIGCGGFGLIYLADRISNGPVSANAPYVMKVEPHANGPLFCELKFYQRVAKPEYISQWKQEKKMKVLGVPEYTASGAHDRRGTKYRFMVMERCGTDLQKLFEGNGKSFPSETVFLLGIKMLNALEYIHEKEYVHADIKASNILTGFGKKSDEVYLVDYGLAYRYTADGKHKEYKEDPKRLHDGTIEFTSRDAHKGVVPSRRGDLEILGYCMLQWLCGKLPWEDNLNNKEYVRDQKIKHMNNINSLLSKCLPSGAKFDELGKFLQYSVDLGYEDRPDYNKCRLWFKQSLKRLGSSESAKVVLSVKSSSATTSGAAAARPKASRKRKSTTTEDELSSSEMELVPSPPRKPAAAARPRGTPKFRKRKSTTTEDELNSSEIEFVPSPPRKPAAAARPRGTPKSRGTTPNRKPAARSSPRVASNGDVIPMPAVPPPGLVNGQSSRSASGAAEKKKSAKKRVQSSTVASQTSPGLKGLKRSRKK